MKRSNSYFAYALLSIFLLSSLWARSVNYNNAVASNNLRILEQTNQIASEYYQECPEVPFVFIPTFSFFNFVTTEELLGLSIDAEELTSSITIYSQILFKVSEYERYNVKNLPKHIQLQSFLC